MSPPTNHFAHRDTKCTISLDFCAVSFPPLLTVHSSPLFNSLFRFINLNLQPLGFHLHLSFLPSYPSSPSFIDHSAYSCPPRPRTIPHTSNSFDISLSQTTLHSSINNKFILGLSTYPTFERNIVFHPLRHAFIHPLVRYFNSTHPQTSSP